MASHSTVLLLLYFKQNFSRFLKEARFVPERCSSLLRLNQFNSIVYLISTTSADK